MQFILIEIYSQKTYYRFTARKKLSLGKLQRNKHFRIERLYYLGFSLGKIIDVDNAINLVSIDFIIAFRYN